MSSYNPESQRSFSCYGSPRRMTATSGFTHRLATMADLPELQELLRRSIRKLIGAYLDDARVEASFDIIGVDTQLIADDTYFVVECEKRGGCCPSSAWVPTHFLTALCGSPRWHHTKRRIAWSRAARYPRLPS